jgi:ABC-type uncharacterized transport system substrate-binding protein
MTAKMKRRDFITLLGGAAAAWPLAARAQQAERVRRIGVLVPLTADDPESQRRVTAFVQGLQELGWTDGRNVRIDIRWTAGDADRMRRQAVELVALGPDVILASGGTVVAALLQASRAVPIVFTLTPDPVGAGFVASLARPGGNATGFTGFEYGLSAKWLELLKELAPRVTRAAILRDASIPQGVGQFAVMQAAAPSLGIELRPVDLRDADEIARGVTAFASEGNGGLIVTGSGLAIVHRQLIMTLAARTNRRRFTSNASLSKRAAWSPMAPTTPISTAAPPAMWIASSKGKACGVAGAGPDQVRAVDQPQARTALGLDMLLTLLARADKVIE